MIMHGHGAKKPHRLQLRLISLLLFFSALFGLAFYSGHLLSASGFFSGGGTAGQASVVAQWQQTESRLTETQAELSLKQSQVNGLQNELREQRSSSEQLNQRLNTLERILESQKTVSGVHILTAEMNWQGENMLVYNLVLVKGGSYPRQTSGKLRMTAHGALGHEAILPLGGKTAELSYRMETHTFLHGSLKWPHTWRPDRIFITHLSRKGTIRDETEIPIGGGET